MGSLEDGVALKRSPLLRSCHTSNGRWFFHRPRSRLARFFLFEKVDYVQLVCTAIAFFFVVMLIQAFLPVSVVEKSGTLGMSAVRRRDGVLQEIGGLDFGEGIRFEPSTLLERFQKEKSPVDFSSFGRPAKRAALIKPRIALVLADLSVDASQLQMVTIAVALREIGYHVEVYAFEDGPVRSIWISARFSLSIVSSYEKLGAAVDWSNYNGILLNSLEAKPTLSSLSQDPFKFLPVVWAIHEKALALRLNHYITTNKTQLIKDWKEAFSRATIVVFPNQLLMMMYSIFDVGNYYVIPGSPVEAWRANNYISLHGSQDPRAELGYKTENFIIAVVGSQFSYSGLFVEHALILESLATILPVFSSPSQVKIGILYENLSTHNQSLEAIAFKLGFSRGSVNQIGFDRDFSSFLGISDVVIYGSFLQEHHFPSILVQAMCLGKLVIAPDLAMITKHVDDSVNGYTFPRQNISMLAQILTQSISNGKLSYSAQNVASTGKLFARKFMVSQVVEGYALLLENILKFPSEVEVPKDVGEIPLKLKEEWQWDLFKSIMLDNYLNNNSMKTSIVDKLEKKWSLSQIEGSASHTTMIADEAFTSIDWREERTIEIENARKRLLEGELKDRTDQTHGTWDEVSRSVKRAERTKNEYYDRDDRELERIGQPLCIYEPYFGEGTWPFLHNTPLYRGIGLSTKGRRPGVDDVDASSRLPILKRDYYRDVLGEHGAFFALAYGIDRIHKNAWIGFQSWRLSTQKKSLTKKAEGMLVKAIETRRHGDALYFWVRMDRDPRNPLQQDFWSFCDVLNAGNCRFAVSRALQKMYGMPPEWDSLPSMPAGGGDSWSVMHSWALPTRSFVEFVMFSRMFIDALDSEIYDEHHQSGTCYLSLSKDRHCYSRVLELLVNVWAYHSARRMVYVNPETGVMEEHHRLKSRRGHMWLRWFSFSTLKGMDEDLAEEFDTEHPSRRWLWPWTGEVFWQGMYERERNTRQQQKERRKQRSREKISRMKTRAKQKPLGKYVKPSSGHSNTTIAF